MWPGSYLCPMDSFMCENLGIRAAVWTDGVPRQEILLIQHRKSFESKTYTITLPAGMKNNVQIMIMQTTLSIMKNRNIAQILVIKMGEYCKRTKRRATKLLRPAFFLCNWLTAKTEAEVISGFPFNPCSSKPWEKQIKTKKDAFGMINISIYQGTEPSELPVPSRISPRPRALSGESLCSENNQARPE